MAVVINAKYTYLEGETDFESPEQNPQEHEHNWECNDQHKFTYWE